MRQIGGGRGDKVTFDEIFILLQTDKVKKDKRMDEAGKEGRKRRREVKKKRKRSRQY